MSDYEFTSGYFPYWTKNYWFLWWPTYVVIKEVPPEKFICLVQKDTRKFKLYKLCSYITLTNEIRMETLLVILSRFILILSEERILKVSKEEKEIILEQEDVINVE